MGSNSPSLTLDDLSITAQAPTDAPAAADTSFLGGGVGINPGFGLSSISSLGLSIGLETIPQPIGGQTFRTIPLPNFNPALYSLSIRGTYGALIGGFTFPLSPTALRKEHVAMANMYDVAGSAATGGVDRVFDSYGVSPVIFTIEGTTGWQRHSTDGYNNTGLQAIAALEQFFFTYAQLNAAAVQNNQPIYTMEFYDYFRGDFWQVEPWGPQGVRMTSQRPILVYYLYRLAGIRDLTNPIAAVYDQVASVLSGATTPSANLPGGVINQNTGANQQDFPNTATPTTSPTLATPGASPESFPSNDVVSSSPAPEGLQQTLNGVQQSSANIQANYYEVTETQGQ